MAESLRFWTRIVAVGAATVVSLACGTNYAYSAWAPQFAERMKLSATQSNLIGTMGNLGMYGSGIPLGLMVDKRGPHLNTLMGSITLGAGYYPLKLAYDNGPGSMNMFLLCFFSLLTGFGSCSAFQAAIKTAALNFPQHRGSATAFPLAAFGLSAFFFTGMAGLIHPNDTSGYLFVLSAGTFFMVLVSLFFIRVPHSETYEALATSEEEASSRSDSNPLHRRNSWQAKRSTTSLRAEPARADSQVPGASGTATSPVPEIQADEQSSLLSEESGPGDLPEEEGTVKRSRSRSSEQCHSHHVDISGLQLFPKPDFWILWTMLGMLTGIGLMTINNIGNDAQALWLYHDPETSKSFILSRQLMHVSIISITSFTGRLLSGIGSDMLVKRHNHSRFWCLVASSTIFLAAQLAAICVSTPKLLWLVSGLSGLGYGALFGVYPALVADAFGVKGLSTNWGFMTLAPVLWGNIFNLFYGAIFDKHSDVLEGGDRVCEVGLECYRAAYYITTVASICGVGMSLGSVWRDRRIMAARNGGS